MFEVSIKILELCYFQPIFEMSLNQLIICPFQFDVLIIPLADYFNAFGNHQLF